jgi:predicted ester cyclase
MTNEELDIFYRRYIVAANSRNLDAIADMIHDEVAIGGIPLKRKDSLAGFKGVVDAVPDFHWQIEDLFTQDGRIAVRLQDTGTPIKRFLGLEPTGAKVEFTQFASYRIKDGRFAEMWFLMDAEAVARQLQSFPLSRASTGT